MKALLLKDYYTLGKSLRSLALIVLLWSVIPMAFLNVFAMIYGSMIPYSAMAYDQQSRWNTFARMLPYREKDIVLSRYVLGWLCIAVGGAAVLVFQNVLSLFSPRFGCSPWTVLAASCVGLLLLDINVPLMLRYGTEKARWVSKLVIILACASTGALGALVNDAKAATATVLSLTLAGMLAEVKGKKVYGYLKKPVKAQVDAIVDELARLPEVAECYEQWNRLRDELERYYKDTPREHKPLSQQQEFKAIKNMVIREAEELRLGTFTFEDAAMKDEVDEDQEEVYYAWSSHWQMAEAYQNAKEILSVYENTEAEKAEQVRLLEQLWGAGFTVAAHLLGKCWRDGMGVLPDDEQAELWFRRAAEAGHDFSQYALGKLLQRKKRMEEAVSWYEKAAEQGNTWAAYRLGKLYLEGKDVPKDTAKAVEYLSDAAQEGNQYAQYALGKLYLTGEDVTQDREQAYSWFWESASQGNEYAQFFLDHFNDNRSPNVLLSATKLLHHMGRIFQDNSIPPCPPGSQRADRKLRQKIRQKKIAMGHKPDDHEEEQNMGGMTMGGM